ncbi:uncharacterized protein LOC129783256 isoform X3 [Falco peregrinus]|uniref:uncharacterized protein LOC129783256 isoform X3 n=1 Tax=Falco peregrinus TaxID=8954 RepID=UPI00247AD9BB|nr:uncharacterized protein LOC129783256 isoform X3 [Falco peregrinus]
MSSPPLSVAVASATEASGRALQALTRLAEALGTPETVPAVLEEVKMVLAEVETALARLNAALVAALEVAAVTEMPPGLNVEGLYRALGAAADANASELERELSQNRRRRRGLWVTRSVAFVLMLVCAPLLSLDVVREALGVTQECHLVPCLATVTLVCQVALWGAGTSQRHLATAASHQRQQATRYPPPGLGHRRRHRCHRPGHPGHRRGPRHLGDVGGGGRSPEEPGGLRHRRPGDGPRFPYQRPRPGGHRGGLGDSDGGQGGDAEVGPGAGGSARGRVGTGTPRGSCWGHPNVPSPSWGHRDVPCPIWGHRDVPPCSGATRMSPVPSGDTRRFLLVLGPPGCPLSHLGPPERSSSS